MLSERNDEKISHRVNNALASALSEKRIVGAVVRVARDGALVAHTAVGLKDREADVPMREDTVFRIASLTKPIVAVAALGLVERGVLSLDADITRWLPEFRPKLEDGTTPAITVRHLLTHTSGLAYGFVEPSDGPYHRANISDGLDQPGLSIEDNLKRLASVPLKFAPGSAWLYSLAFDVLGEVIARATKSTLPKVVADAITNPLELQNTSFSATSATSLATPYADGKPDPIRMKDGTYVPFHDMPVGSLFAPSRALDPKSYPSGGAGLVGTADDYLRFLEAIRTRNKIFSKAQLDAMTSDQIPSLSSQMLGDGWGYGYGVGVLRDARAASSPLSNGSFRWGGAYGHSWFVDPAAKISAVLLTNTAFEGMDGALRFEIQHALLSP
jgi:CubicO group peptidase (beta-lactamase class C family)